MITNGNGQTDFAGRLEQALRPPLPIVQQPTLSIHMSGHLRLQVPCKPETQMLYDLLSPELKLDPGKHATIAAEALEAQHFAVKQFTETLKSSPQLAVISNPVRLQCSYGIVDGKLFYVYLLPVRSA